MYGRQERISCPFDMSGKRKLKTLTIEDKVNVILEVDAGKRKKKDIASKFGIPATTLSTILKNRVSLLNAYKRCTFDPARKRQRKSQHDDVDSALLKWFWTVRDKNVPVNGPLLREKAEELAKELGYNHFKATVGWMDRFIGRHGICFRECGALSRVPHQGQECTVQDLTLKQQVTTSESASVGKPYNLDSMQDKSSTSQLVHFTETIKNKASDVSFNTEDETNEETDDVNMEAEEFLLKWNDYQSNLVSVFSELCDSEQFVDVTLACEDRMFQAHKLILSACSPYFRNLFVQNPCKHPIVFLKDVESSHIEALLRFMYHGEISIQQTELMPLLRTAQSLHIKGLPHMLFPEEYRECDSDKDIKVMQGSQDKKQRNDGHQKNPISGEQLCCASFSQGETHGTSDQIHMQPSLSTSSMGHSQQETAETFSLRNLQPELNIKYVSVARTEKASDLIHKTCSQNTRTSGGGTYIKTFIPSSASHLGSDIEAAKKNCEPDPGASLLHMPRDTEALQYCDTMLRVKEEVEETQEISENWSFAQAMESRDVVPGFPVLPAKSDRDSRHTLDTGCEARGTWKVSEAGQKQQSPIAFQQHTSSSVSCELHERKMTDK